MSEDKLQAIRQLFFEFSDLSLTDFRSAFRDLVNEKNPAVDRYLSGELKNFRGNRTMRCEIAAVLAEREDETYLEDFALVIEKETEVGLCKECIQGLARIGTQEAIQKLEFLAHSKPNATISSLLRQEMDKLRHEEKEPVHYYLEHLANGNKNARHCIRSAKVLIKMGDVRVVDEILAKFPEWDDLARAEGAKVISQLGESRHLSLVLDTIDTYLDLFEHNAVFIETAEGFEQHPKEERLERIHEAIQKVLTANQKPHYLRFREALEAHQNDPADQLMETILEQIRPPGLHYYLKSMMLIKDSKVAHAASFHEETLRSARVRQSRLRHLIGQLGYGIGKISSQGESEPALRERAVSRLTQLVKAKDGDVAKLALYGTSFMVKPEDTSLLAATLKSHQIEGMSRLISTLERKHRDHFTDFFLDVSMNHDILDVQEMAMRALGASEEVFTKLRKMLENPAPEAKRMAIRILGEIQAKPFIADLVDLLEGQSDIIRIQAIQSLGKIGEPSVLSNINEVIYDAKSPVLVEACLEAIANIGGDEAVHLLFTFAERTRNRKSAVTAIRLLAGSYKTWNNPLPEDTSALVFKHLKVWFEERDEAIRSDAYRIAGNAISHDLKYYDKLKVLFKDASTRMRAQATWDKEEMNEAGLQLRQLNRNYFFLKDMLEFQKNLSTYTRGFDNESSVTRVATFEKLIKVLEQGERFVLNEELEALLEEVVLTGLTLGEASWNEQNLLYQIAAYSSSPRLNAELSARVRSVPVQAKASLLEALSRMGLSLTEIKDLSAIRKVLVVEGSGFFRKRLVKFLENAAYEVQSAGDLEEAGIMLTKALPDLILTEIMFNGNPIGVDFAEKMVQTYGPRVQWIFSTNNRDAGILQRVSKLKPKKIFFKPYPLEQLEAVIKG